jgi:meiotically up-regulated gene 157 (Mug157) protein
VKRALAGVLCALFAASVLAPARAQNLIVPMTGQRARPIQAQTLFHTLFADFYSEPDATTYVQTGDIPAMWLRDSAAQTIPYVRFANGYPILAARFAGVIEHEARNVLIDPYANAFTPKYGVWEEKWEVDSLAWPVLLAWIYFQRTNRRMIFTPQLHRALRRVVDTYRCEQLHAQCSRYRHRGAPLNVPYNHDTGMIWGAFRPSDDPTRYPFNVPQQAIATVALQDAAALALEGYGDRNLANEAGSMAAQVYTGIVRYGMAFNPRYGGWVYVYETDGLGNATYVDDANVPNLTGLPLIGWTSPDDPAYVNTRNYALSPDNPWYFGGIYGEGLGSPHTPDGFVWPLGIITRALTATSAVETAQAITTLAETDSEDGLIHESFWPDGYWEYTRADFGWANAFYAELLFRSVGGFRALPMTVSGNTIVPFERLNQTPVLTRLPMQLYEAGLMYRALGNLLEQARGKTIISPIRSMMVRSAGGIHWHEVRD